MRRILHWTQESMEVGSVSSTRPDGGLFSFAGSGAPPGSTKGMSTVAVTQNPPVA